MTVRQWVFFIPIISYFLSDILIRTCSEASCISPSLHSRYNLCTDLVTSTALTTVCSVDHWTKMKDKTSLKMSRFKCLCWTDENICSVLFSITWRFSSLTDTNTLLWCKMSPVCFRPEIISDAGKHSQLPAHLLAVYVQLVGLLLLKSKVHFIKQEHLVSHSPRVLPHPPIPYLTYHNTLTPPQTLHTKLTQD